jgi:hypothetical protein
MLSIRVSRHQARVMAQVFKEIPHASLQRHSLPQVSGMAQDMNARFTANPPKHSLVLRTTAVVHH